MAVTVITGTSSGIGLATALHFARRGDQVYATMRNLDRAGALRDAAAAENLLLTFLQLDVDDEASVQQAIATALDQAGHIDVLVNNAGITHHGPIEHTNDATARAIFETNVFGPLRTIRAVLPGMRARQQGAIVNVTSLMGRLSPACGGLYMMTKHALEAASEALAVEVRPYNIRVAIIEPGFIATRMQDAATRTFGHDPASPYADAERRVSLIIAQGKQTSADPGMVAEAIEHAVTTPAPKLRYLVGPSAELFVGGRARMSDEEWVEMSRKMTDEEFFRELAARFPAPATV